MNTKAKSATTVALDIMTFSLVQTDTPQNGEKSNKQTERKHIEY